MAQKLGDGTVLSYSGGAGSISGTFAEISALAVEMRRIVHLLEPLERQLCAEWTWLGNAAGGAGAYPYASLEAMRDAWFQSSSLHETMVRLAANAGQAGVNYAASEANTANSVANAQRSAALGQGMDAWRWGPLSAVKIALDIRGLQTTEQDRGLRDSLETMLNQSGAYVAGALGPSVTFAYLISQLGNKNAPAAGTLPAFGLRKVVDGLGIAKPGALTVRQVPEQESHPRSGKFYPPGHAVSAPGVPWSEGSSFAAMLGGSNDAYSYPPGSIGVVRVDKPDGDRAWVVHLPGTEDWGTFDSSNPFDMEGNMEAMTAANHEKFTQQGVLVQELIKESLTASGALPGEDVVLTGHSGGGIHAAAAAADPDFLAEVNVQMIVIAGAPARNAGVGEGVSVVALENDNDVVTALDFGPPMPAPNWVTATSHRPPSGDAAGLVDVLAQAHSLDNYIDDALLLDQSGDPAVVASAEKLRTILGVGAAGGVIAGSKWVYQGRDGADPGKGKPAPSEAKKKNRTRR